MNGPLVRCQSLQAGQLHPCLLNVCNFGTMDQQNQATHSFDQRSSALSSVALTCTVFQDGKSILNLALFRNNKFK